MSTKGAAIISGSNGSFFIAVMLHIHGAAQPTEQRSRHLSRYPALSSDAAFSHEHMKEIRRAWIKDHESWVNADTIYNYNRWLRGRRKGDPQKAYQVRNVEVSLPDHRRQARGDGIHSASDMQCCTACRSDPALHERLGGGEIFRGLQEADGSLRTPDGGAQTSFATPTKRFLRVLVPDHRQQTFVAFLHPKSNLQCCTACRSNTADHGVARRRRGQRHAP